MPSSILLKFQIGPVQDFIAQARSTRDLWSGSYLLSWLVAKGIRELLACGGSLIFPDKERQPLLDLPRLPGDGDHTALLTPNLPNIFIAEISEDAREVAGKVKKAIEAKWMAIAEAVWKKRERFGLPDAAWARFEAQVSRHLSIAWQATPLADESPEAYLETYRRNGLHLDAVRQTRDFSAWNPAIPEADAATGHAEKDSLSGKEEAVLRGSGTPDKSDVWDRLVNRHADHLGAASLIKRVWHLAYLQEAQHLLTASDKFPIRSIPAIAARTSKLDDDEDPQEKTAGEKYVAAIAFDGDSIGRWVNGDFLEDQRKLKEHHRSFSRALSRFALDEVRKIVEEQVAGTDENGRPAKVALGQLIYAGGDDVVCLVPADAALDVAERLHERFLKATDSIRGKDPETLAEVKPDASVGIAIAHIHAPLQDLIREAQKAEKRAKTEVGRPAFSITLMKRSGEISRWGSKWSSGGVELYRAIADKIRPDQLSAKFPHRVCQLLTPYLTRTTGISKQQDAIDDPDQTIDLIGREFAHSAERQGSKDLARALDEPLKDYLQGILVARREREQATGKQSTLSATQELISSVIDLCTTVAFADRTKPEPAEKQTVAS